MHRLPESEHSHRLPQCVSHVINTRNRSPNGERFLSVRQRYVLAYTTPSASMVMSGLSPISSGNRTACRRRDDS